MHCFTESVVANNRPQYNWYHQQFRRVPTIDECYTDDIVCYTEANEQFKRDKLEALAAASLTLEAFLKTVATVVNSGNGL
ncbi:NADH dehydrogenase [ubiquinone] 1 beta subcomplex subunit 10 [Portunus trituberculatus]|uniref:NADH dehydrogenase [ubiquinone] 1 beta subcomplex subunit 10 n=1 Tax=Portunus trituberculatus TaxID=210409 RepID=A0A5B7IG21_PORTR|nr:NADH dehydrogenase [ubiquinone] 1 beta subcomplex subunit 10 [Portunus trituberculatus]